TWSCFSNTVTSAPLSCAASAAVSPDPPVPSTITFRPMSSFSLVSGVVGHSRQHLVDGLYLTCGRPGRRIENSLRDDPDQRCQHSAGNSRVLLFGKMRKTRISSEALGNPTDEFTYAQPLFCGKFG